jgi:hypothetical protein
MSIIVVCPGCLKSFKVSDKFAGKSGPCPKCKRTLQVPTKETEVKIHVPEAFAGGGKSAAGKLITKPIARVNAKARDDGDPCRDRGERADRDGDSRPDWVVRP